MKNYMSMMVAGVLAAGCTQQPAPVLSGYTGKQEVTPTPHYTLKAARAGEPSVVETRTNVAKTTAYKYESSAPLMQEEDLSRIEPAAGPATAQEVTFVEGAAAPQGEGGTYTFKDRDTLYSVAREHGTTARKLIELNNLESAADVTPGQVLVMPANNPNVKPSAVDAVARAEQATKGVQEQVIAKEKQMQLIEPAAGERPETGLRSEAAPQQALQQGDLQAYTENGSKIVTKDGMRYAEHMVAAGETVYRISVNYKASVFDIMAANDFQSPQDLKSGTLVRVPLPQAAEAAQPQVATTTETTEQTNVVEATPQQPAEVQVTTVQKTTTVVQAPEGTIGDSDKAAIEKVVTNIRTETKTAMAADDTNAIMLVQKGRIDPLAAKAKGLAWPVKGKIIRKYGEAAEGVNHTGINIAVPKNTPVVAADGGTVLYADSGLKTYGNLVLIRHTDGMVTAYAHNNKLLVSKGEKVKKGQVVALSGSSGNVEEPQVHFEIRKEARAIDPLRVLASR